MLPAWLFLVCPPPGRSVKAHAHPRRFRTIYSVLQGVNRRESRPDGMCSSDKMRKRETMRREERISFLR